MSDFPHLTRRHFLITGTTIVSTLPFARVAHALDKATPACLLAAEQEIGPYYIADELLRSDIAEDQTGIPLVLRIRALDVSNCKPLAGAAIDIWHCNALGIYSGYTKQNEMMPPPEMGGDHPDHNHRGPPPDFANGEMPLAPAPTDTQTFLRGVQLTDNNGEVAFTSIIPGYYQGRTNHIHFKVRLSGAISKRDGGQSYGDGHVAHTGQLFFPEKHITRLMRQEPYSDHKIRRTAQGQDDVFQHQHGAEMLARLYPVNAGDLTKGYRANVTVSVDPDATPGPAMRGHGPDSAH